MAIYPGTESILEAAQNWKNRCLIGDDSVLAPGRSLWASEHLSSLVSHYVENPKTGKRHFLEKMEEQLEGASAPAQQLAAEMLWVMMLFPVNFNHKTKVRKVRTVWEWSGESLPDSRWLDEPLESGIGSVGPGFINHQPYELKYLVVLMQELKSWPGEERQRVLQDPWALTRWLDSHDDLGSRQLRHILTHLLLPERFERIASMRHKREILAAFGREDASRAQDLEDLDRELFDLRQELEERYSDRESLDYYRPPLLEQWRPAPDFEMELAEEELDRARSAFLRRMEGFSSFSEPGELYRQEERGYKDELKRRFQDLAEALPTVEDLTEDEAVEIVSRVSGLFTEKLDPYSWSQNLINWRYTRFLTELEPPEAMVFVRALIELIEPEISAPSRVNRFNEDVWPVLENHDASGYAVSRSLPTFFLSLYDPDKDIYVRTDLFNSMGERLIGERIFLNKRMGNEQYARALAFAERVREALNGWGWQPRDMIDVQSFIWQASEQLKKEEKAAEEDDDDPSKVGEGGDSDYETGEIIELSTLTMELEANGYHFPPELVANYLLALQTKRFVILTGISGTGKTKLAMKVADFFSDRSARGEAPERDDHREIIAVRPDWTDPRGLIGYHNPITDRYLTTGFLRLLLRAREEESAAQREERRPRPFFVILDEMNLARVEHYFSDFLSALESQHPLALHDAAPSEDGKTLQIPPRLSIPRNVFFTGTVNVDETTHMFSPKVLDRAFTLELNEVDLDGWALGETRSPGAEGTLDLPKLKGHLVWERQPGAEDWNDFGDLLRGHLRETVTALNRALSPWGYHFGYRVAGEIARFVLLAQRQGAESEEALWSALDLALLQKVLPKFHGTEQELEPPLRTVAFVARHGRAPATEDGVSARLDAEEGEGGSAARLPRCAQKVDRMRRQLRLHGFAAYIQ